MANCFASKGHYPCLNMEQRDDTIEVGKICGFCMKYEQRCKDVEYGEGRNCYEPNEHAYDFLKD